MQKNANIDKMSQTTYNRLRAYQGPLKALFLHKSNQSVLETLIIPTNLQSLLREPNPSADPAERGRLCRRPEPSPPWGQDEAAPRPPVSGWEGWRERALSHSPWGVCWETEMRRKLWGGNTQWTVRRSTGGQSWSKALPGGPRPQVGSQAPPGPTPQPRWPRGAALWWSLRSH